MAARLNRRSAVTRSDFHALHALHVLREKHTGVSCKSWARVAGSAQRPADPTAMRFGPTDRSRRAGAGRDGWAAGPAAVAPRLADRRGPAGPGSPGPDPRPTGRRVRVPAGTAAGADERSGRAAGGTPGSTPRLAKAGGQGRSAMLDPPPVISPLPDRSTGRLWFQESPNGRDRQVEVKPAIQQRDEPIFPIERLGLLGTRSRAEGDRPS
jgi:hypothetical protein